MTDGWHRILASFFLDGTYKVVRVKSLWPTWGRYGLEWPTLLVDRQGSRSTVTPVLDRHWLERFRLFRKDSKDD